MTSEPDSKPGRRPPTIELKATEVQNPASAQEASEPEGESAAPDEAAPSYQASSHQASGDQASAEGGAEQPARPAGGRNRMQLYAVAAAVGAVAIAAIITGLWIVGSGPAREAAAPPDTAAPSAAAPAPGGDIAARLDKIEHTTQAPRSDPALANRVAATEAQTKSLADALSALNRRIDDLAAATQSASKQAGAAAAAADAAKDAAENATKDIAKDEAARAERGTAQGSDIDALTSRIAALENTVRELSDNDEHPSAGADDQAARLTIAAGALRAAVEGGMPYRAELAAVQSLGADQNALAALEPFAAGGVPSAAALGRELAALAPELQRASDPRPAETTFLGRLETNAQKLVRITPLDAPAGNDPSAAVARIAGDAARADIAAALNDIAGLPETARPRAADWVKRAQAREAAIAASRQISADALAALSKPASQ